MEISLKIEEPDKPSPDRPNDDVLLLKKVLPRAFRNKINSANANFTIIRANVKNLEECSLWISEYSKRSNSKWITRTSKPRPTRFLCRKVFVCHHSRYRKRESRSGKKTKNLDCKATIDILVKIATRHTKRKDPYIQKGLPAVIKIKNGHNHSLDAIEALSALPASVETKNCFKGYFDNGLGVAEALHYHGSQLVLIKKENILDNTTINPKYRTVQYWYDQWRKQAGGSSATSNLPRPKSVGGKGKKATNEMSVQVQAQAQPQVKVEPPKIKCEPSTVAVATAPVAMTFVTATSIAATPIAHIKQQYQVSESNTLIEMTTVRSVPQLAHNGTHGVISVSPGVHNGVTVLQNGMGVLHDGAAPAAQQAAMGANHWSLEGDGSGWQPPPPPSDDFDQLGLYLADCLRRIKDPTKQKQYEHRLLQTIVGIDGDEA